MQDPHKLLDYETWWNKSLGNIKPYRIPALSPDIVNKLNTQLDASSDRIWRTRPSEEATKIIALLRELINSHNEPQSYKFSWNLSLYKNPPKKFTRYHNCVLQLYNLESFPFTTHLLPLIEGSRVRDWRSRYDWKSNHGQCNQARFEIWSSSYFEHPKYNTN